jgi:hypothetical protein
MPGFTPQPLPVPIRKINFKKYPNLLNAIKLDFKFSLRCTVNCVAHLVFFHLPVERNSLIYKKLTYCFNIVFKNVSACKEKCT